jgi:hypothetical protein
VLRDLAGHAAEVLLVGSVRRREQQAEDPQPVPLGQLDDAVEPAPVGAGVGRRVDRVELDVDADVVGADRARLGEDALFQRLGRAAGMHHRVRRDRRGVRRSGQRERGQAACEEQINVKNSQRDPSRVYKNAE